MGKWTADYNGHTITAKDCFAGGQLYIDGELADQQSGSFSCTLNSSLPNGENVRAQLVSGTSCIRCTITVDGDVVYSNS